MLWWVALTERNCVPHPIPAVNLSLLPSFPSSLLPSFPPLLYSPLPPWQNTSALNYSQWQWLLVRPGWVRFNKALWLFVSPIQAVTMKLVAGASCHMWQLKITVSNQMLFVCFTSVVELKTLLKKITVSRQCNYFCIYFHIQCCCFVIVFTGFFFFLAQYDQCRDTALYWSQETCTGPRSISQYSVYQYSWAVPAVLFGKLGSYFVCVCVFCFFLSWRRRLGVDSPVTVPHLG